MFGEAASFSKEEIERLKEDSRRAYKNDKSIGQHSLRKKIDRKGKLSIMNVSLLCNVVLVLSITSTPSLCFSLFY